MFEIKFLGAEKMEIKFLDIQFRVVVSRNLGRQWPERIQGGSDSWRSLVLKLFSVVNRSYCTFSKPVRTAAPSALRGGFRFLRHFLRSLQRPKHTKKRPQGIRPKHSLDGHVVFARRYYSSNVLTAEGLEIAKLLFIVV